jgi:Spy/CpxP family protein refolding chaperone
MKSRFFMLVLVIGVMVCASVAFAQDGRRGRGGPGGFGGFGGDNMMFLLMNDQVREELEIVPEQLEKLRAIGEKGREEMREMFSGMRDLNDEQRRAKFEEMRGKMQERAKSLQAEVDTVLLPHQKERLQQIRTQMQFQRGAAGALESQELAEKLGLTDAQKTRLAEVRAEVEKELQEKMAEIRKQAEEKILGVLTPAQQEQVKKMRGEPFEFQRPQFDRNRRPGGDTST